MRLPYLLALAFGATLLSPLGAHASDLLLPDACGPDKARFDIKTEKDHPLPGAPEAGQATIVVLGVKVEHAIGQPSYRYGMDGAWIGATKGDGYFTVTVPPGDHHFCAQWQSSIKAAAKNIGLLSLKTEAGKTYYVQFAIRSVVTGVSGMGNNVSAVGEMHPEFIVLNEDEGKFRTKNSEYDSSKAK